MHRSALVIAMAFSMLAPSAGCALQQKRVVQQLENPGPVQCATAMGDIRVLEHEKAHVAARIAEGVTAIHPAGAVIGVLAGVEGTKLKVATGKYNELIDQRIAQIQQTCGLAHGE